MEIANPGVVLPLITVVAIAGVAVCAYFLFRTLRGMRARSADARPAAPAKKEGGADPAPAAGQEDRPDEQAPDPEPNDDIRQQEEQLPPPPWSEVPPHDEGEVEVFRVLRVGQMKQLVVELDGRRYRQLAEIEDGPVGRRVLLAIQELIDFAGPYGQKALPEMQRYSQTEAPQEETAAQKAFLDELQKLPVEEATAPKVDVVGFWRKGLGRSGRGGATDELQPFSIIDEIEELLQSRLAEVTDMAGRSIHFGSDSAGELRIEVDGLLYGSPDEVPDEEVAVLLRSCIKAWEER
jgi:hypothetical protein